MYTCHRAVVDEITLHKPPLFKMGKNVVVEVILLHFRVRPFCVVISSSLWNWTAWIWILEPKLTRHSALHYHWPRWASQLPKLDILEVLDTFITLQEAYAVNEGTHYLSTLCLLGSVEFKSFEIYYTTSFAWGEKSIFPPWAHEMSYPCTHVQTVSLFSVIHYH